MSELRRRGVFRAAGLYIALTWLSLQIADVVFPAFDIPDSALRYILFGAMVGFPFVMAFSWFYDVSSEGIRSEEELEEAGETRRGGYLSGGTIVLLVLALGVSLYANYEQASVDEPPAEHEIISILVSDFINQTGDPIFDGSLEPALAISMEGAPFISAFARHDASAVAQQIKGQPALDEDTARLVSVREGIRLILSGTISPRGDGYEFALRAIDSRQGDVVANATASANTKVDVLPAVGKLAIQIREELGDASLEDDPEASETFTAASLEAARYYTIAQAYNRTEQNIEAVEYYQKAIEEDPNFGRAYSGWAMSEMRLGRVSEAEQLWEKTLALLDTMTERERYRTLGGYYLTVTGNYTKAIETYKLLIEKYPADNAGRNNLAVAYFQTRQFDKALKQGGELAEMYPNTAAYKSNFALYAMYAGDFETAHQQATELLAHQPGFYLGYVPLAIAELARGDRVAAQSVYERMAEQGPQAASTASVGLADIALMGGDWQAAEQLLRAGITADRGFGNAAGAARKGVDLALALLEQGKPAEARVELDWALAETDSVSQLLPGARLLVRMGDIAAAEAIRQTLDKQLQVTSRAAADMIAAEIALAKDDVAGAVDALNASIEHNDTWLARFDLGRAYIQAGYYAEALGELEKCQARLGESAALFMDDIPTFNYSVPLLYWLGVTRLELGMKDAGRKQLVEFLALRAENDQSDMTRDARARLAAAGN